ncbi:MULTISPECIES: LPS assembly lipoprotein LptE [unclassified Leisingera]|uniref:LPS assembly lipoprotein LptE n=1 Tax=unclassified Leisingera TaxID=2614906 RepID=UPI0002D7A95E|nr:MULTISPECIES: LPS assembly lipoprotein LptE [unclassified Leisingera]KIC22186.1 lipoprotein [Leisingera sp. ANG-S3]KIC32755.1 lipoprotein [Leisingera sp. ANG-S5]KIC53632.1 lipoprotein [Leisingera sp. ANG-S]KID08026.1 lipoprotein [Leisingera sp. ANG1]
MSLLNCRTLLLALPLVVAACGFTPVYAPGGTGAELHDNIEVQAPEEIKGASGSDAYFLVQNLEQRLGRGSGAAYKLDLTLSTREEGQAITADNEITRYSVIGTAAYSLTRLSDGKVTSSGTVRNFTGYSATGSTVETLAGERDAHERLMAVLADQITAQILATADLSAAAE